MDSGTHNHIRHNYEFTEIDLSAHALPHPSYYARSLHFFHLLYSYSIFIHILISLSASLSAPYSIHLTYTNNKEPTGTSSEDRNVDQIQHVYKKVERCYTACAQSSFLATYIVYGGRPGEIG